ncbi:FHA domain-containing protein [Streptomyces griseus]|uniref:FHA domain-containing protein n=1 Tax=Streptomyces griseus TaxID=1911 RepID=UPI00055F88B4|nr:FHA domain-containing protein [Streptomyces griseus]
MQIRLTVVDPLGPPSETRPRAATCDVLVTAPAGTALAAVASALASAVSGDGGGAPAERGREQGGGPAPRGREQTGPTVVLYAGAERLDAQRCTLGEPPLVDGAVLSLGAPADPEPHPEVDDAPAQLHVVAGPDAGGVHLLHGGQIHVGRSADADVPLDDPDVSRLHCAVTLSPDGSVTVADLGSTNGTTLEGIRVGTRPVRLAAGALLRIGESALRLAPAGGPGARVPTTPDGEGHVRVPCGTDAEPGTGSGGAAPASARRPVTVHARVPAPGGGGAASPAADRAAHAGDGTGPDQPSGYTLRGYGAVDWAATATPGSGPQGSAEPPVVPGQGGAPRIETHDDPHGTRSRGSDTASRGSDTASRRGPEDGTAPHGAAPGGPSRGARPRPTAPGDLCDLGDGTRGSDTASRSAAADPAPRSPAPRSPSPGAPPRGTSRPAPGDGGDTHGGGFAFGAPDAPPVAQPSAPSAHHLDADPDVSEPRESSRRKGTPLRGTDVPQGVRRRGGLSAWARRLKGGRGTAEAAGSEAYDDGEAPGAAPEPSATAPGTPETWPDPAALLLTALGPGPRLWERGPVHPEALTVRLGTADRAAPDGSGLLPAVPVTADLREVGALGLAGPRTRLSGLARAVLAQLAALHSPDALELVLISADRTRPPAERVAEWSWLGWLPHLRPGHGQDCRLLLAHDREQAAARTGELLRRLEDHLAETGTVAAADLTHPFAPGAARHTVPSPRPSWAVDDEDTDGVFPGPYTVVVVDGDPGGADLREAVARLAVEGPRAGIHVVCLAETAPASPASPVTDTYEAACAASPTFRECGAVALLSGDVATALRLLRIARTPAEQDRPDGLQSRRSGPVGHGTVAVVDAVSPAWAERFARALAPLRTDGTGEHHARVSAPLPQAARLLDELGLARATPASLMARWADAADDAEALGGRARAVLGAGPRGPVGVDLVADGPHLLIEGPAASGRTELLRALVASLAAAERPDRLGIVLVDGRDTVGTGGGGHGEGLRVCTDVPHVTTHLAANDPVRMREFAQSLSAELKRRAELLGRSDFAEWHTHREVSGRIVAQRGAARGAPKPTAAPGSGAGDLESPPSSTLRLRPSAAARRQAETAPPLPRLIVVVDDLDALVAPPLGSPGRPAAGSVVRALEAVARDGERLGVHLVAAAALGGRTAESETAKRAALRITLDAPGSGPDEPSAGRGGLAHGDGRVTPFQGGRVTGRIPRTATLRPTVVPLDWQRMGDPPTRRPVRELGNGPTDLALLASALERAAREVSAAEVPSLL